MASQKIFKEDVYRAARELVAEGRSPSILNIRAVLGGGGNTTIAKFRQEWLDESDQNKTDSTEEDIIVPKDVAEFFHHISKKLWKFSFEKAADDFEEIKVAMSESKSKADDEVRTASKLISEQDTKIEDLENRTQQLQIEKKAADKLAENTQYQLESANAIIRDLKADLRNTRQTYTLTIEKKAKAGADLQILQAKFDDLKISTVEKEKKQKEEYKKQFQKFTEAENVAADLKIKNATLQQHLDNSENRIQEMNGQIETFQNQLVGLAKSNSQPNNDNIK